MAEGRTIRTCSRLIAVLAGASAAPAAASIEDARQLSAYVQARAADSAGAAAAAAERYAAALALAPGNEVLAARALSQAVAAGDRALALRAARMLAQSGQLAPDARLLLLAEALRTRDWRAATAQVDGIERDRVFAFMTPVLRAWLALGSNSGDPIAIIDAARSDPLAAAYSQEHRPLLLLALGRADEGVPPLIAAAADAGGRATRLRIAGAATLVRARDRKRALTLLTGDAPPLLVARRLVERRRPVPAPIVTAAAGVAEFLVRVATDLHRQNATPLALSYARLATFLAPENSETWLVTSELLAARARQAEALAALANIAADDPFAAMARDARIALLVGGEDRAAALGELEAAARARTASSADWARLGDLYAALDRHADAADAYGKALALPRPAGGQEEWALWLLRGGALHEAGRWPEARAALEAAYKLAPQQPIVLNYLGYAQLERRENLAEADRLIREASRLRPDDAAITDSLGWSHYVRGELPKAIELLERAAQGSPGDAAINEHLGDAYFAAGRRFEARYAWQAALLQAEAAAAQRLAAKIEAGLTPKLASP